MARLKRLYKVKSGSTVSDRLNFYSKNDNKCRIWIGAKNKKGYGLINTSTQSLAHRTAWEEKHGPIPKGMRVLHHCDRPSCINVDHLFLGTDKDNSDDKFAKGRNINLKGEDHGCAKLTEKDITIIRSSNKTHGELARKFRVGRQAIRKIRYRTTWRHI